MDQMSTQLAFGSLALVIGLSGWLLPYRWNLLRLRRPYARLVSEGFNQVLPKVLGTLFAVAGLAILIGAVSGL